MISEETKKRWQEIVDGAGNEDNRLTDWEREFVDSVAIQLGHGKELTHKQTKCLYRIAERIGL